MKWVFTTALDRNVGTELVEEAASWLSSGRFPFYRGALFRHRARCCQMLGIVRSAPLRSPLPGKAQMLGSRFD